MDSHKKNLHFYVLGSGALVFERAFRILTGLFIQGYLARYLGPENFGHLNFTVSFISILSTVVLFGFDEFVAKEFIREEVHSLKTLNKVLGIRFILAGLNYGLLWILTQTYYAQNPVVPNLLLLYGLILFCQPTLIYEVYLLTHRHIWEVFKARLIAGIMANLLRLAGLFSNMGVAYFALISTSDDFLNRLLNHFSLKKKYSSFKWQHWFPINKGLTQDGFFAFLCAIFIIFERRITLLIMERFGNYHELGIFTSAYSIIEYSLMVPLILMGVIFPSVLKDYGDNSAKYQKSKSDYYGMITFTGWLCGAGLYVLAELVVSIIFGNIYADATKYLRMMCLCIPINYFLLARLKIALLERKVKIWAVLGSVSLVMNLLLQYWAMKMTNALDAILVFYGLFFVINILFACFSIFIRNSMVEFIKSFWFPITLLRSYKNN
jgi:O-antigen/teichoic acid export membrane protein